MTSVRATRSLVRTTPMILAHALGEGVWLKLESLQRTGSFKLRGACLALDALSDEERARGVITASAGNHGQGLALASAHLGISAQVVVPVSTPAIKKLAIASYGAAVVEVSGGYDAAEAEARRRASDTGRIFVSPFDDANVILGNGGTLAREIVGQLPDVAQVIAPVGGGGLIAGLTLELAPRGVLVYGVQPARNCAMYHSLLRGAPLVTYEGESTLAEGCEGGVAEQTYRACERFGVRIGLVSEDAIREAMAFAYQRLGIVCEASAAVAIAGVISGAVSRADAGGPTVVVVSGSNVSPELLDDVLREEHV